MTTMQFVDQGVPLVTAARLAVWPPERLRGMQRIGNVQYRRRHSGAASAAPEHRDAHHLLGCASCGAGTGVYRDDWRASGYLMCSRDECHAILTYADEGVWIPAAAGQPPVS